MKKQEDIIRDYIAEHLELLDPNLKLIQKEYKLNNLYGSKGFIDILAIDIERNFVIIEIKHSDKAARETLNEINKYIGLIKQNYHAKESEIRCIIASVHWHELLAPFSEFVSQSKYHIEGVILNLDENDTPIKATRVKPIPTHEPREYAPYQIILEYNNKDDRDKIYPYVRSHIQKRGVSNFVLLKIENHKNPLVIYKYAILIGFETYTAEKYLELIKKVTSLEEEDWMIYSQEEDLSTLCDVFISTFDFHKFCDMLEIISFETFSQMITSAKWEVTNTEKSGIFNSDPRYDIDFLKTELSGISGYNQTIFIASSESENKHKMAEIRNTFRNVLQDMPEWEFHIDHILDDLEKNKDKFNMTIIIYNPLSLLLSFVKCFEEKTEKYMPYYSINVNFKSYDLIFNGFIVWNGKTPNLEYFSNLFRNSALNVFIEETFLNGKEKIMKNLELVYFNGCSIITNGQKIERGILDYSKKYNKDGEYVSLKAFFNKNTTLMNLLQYYTHTTIETNNY